MRVDGCNQRVDERPRAPLGRQPVEHPGAFGQPLDQPRSRQEFQVTRKSRLALVQHLCKLAHGQLAMRQQGENPRPRDLAGGAELRDEVCKSHGMHITI